MSRNSWIHLITVSLWTRKLKTDDNSVPNYCQSVCPKQTTLEEDRELFLKIFFNFMFMIWDSRQEDWQFFFYWVLNTVTTRETTLFGKGCFTVVNPKSPTTDWKSKPISGMNSVCGGDNWGRCHGGFWQERAWPSLQSTRVATMYLDADPLNISQHMSDDYNTLVTQTMFNLPYRWSLQRIRLTYTVCWCKWTCVSWKNGDRPAFLTLTLDGTATDRLVVPLQVHTRDM